MSIWSADRQAQHTGSNVFSLGVRKVQVRTQLIYTFTYSIRLLSYTSKVPINITKTLRLQINQFFFSSLVSSSVIFLFKLLDWLVKLLLRMRQLIWSISFGLLPFLLNQLEKRNTKKNLYGLWKDVYSIIYKFYLI